MLDTKIYHEHILGDNKYFIPEKMGVYVITHIVDRIYAEKYIGSTINLHDRMYGHSNKEIMYVDIYITDSEFIARSLERILIHLIKPDTNTIVQPLTNEDKELMKDSLIEDILRQHSNNIIKIGYRYLKYIDYDERVSLEKSKCQSIIKLNLSSSGIRLGKRKLTDTTSSRQMTFDREFLDEIGYTAGTYTVLYEPNRVSIIKEVKDVIVND